MPKLKHPSTSSEHTCCGTIQDARYKARRNSQARRSKPQPWIVLKLMVLVTLGIIGYSTYVYVARFCLRMIKRESEALAGRSVGIVFLVVYSILLLWTLWAYVKVVITSPGQAKDHVPKTAPLSYPLPPQDDLRHSGNPDIERGTDHNNTLAGPAYELQQPASVPSVNVSPRHSPTDTDESPSKPNPKSQRSGDKTHRPRKESHPSRTDSHPNSKSPQAREGGNDAPHRANQPTKSERQRSNSNNLPPLSSPSRCSSTVPILLPEYRYCTRDRIIKPFRAHHCRSCGTCILKYDHHCPWIGQCVGARNQKFFINFLQSACVLCLWTFPTLLAYSVRGGWNNISPQEVVVIAISGLFAIFTSTLLTSHVHLTLLNQTTVENMGFQTLRQNESMMLAKTFRFWEVRAKSRIRQQWDTEWGVIGREGNLWWLGDRRKNWEDVMGKRVSGWFLPIGHSLSDGLTYPPNPRFDPQGRWRRREEWPRELLLL